MSMYSYPVPWDLRTADGLDGFAAKWHSIVSANPSGLLHTTAYVMVTRCPYKDDDLERPGLVKIDDPTRENTQRLWDAVRDISGRHRAIAVAVMLKADESPGEKDDPKEELNEVSFLAPPRRLLIWVEHMLPALNGRAWSAPLTWDGDTPSVGPLGLRDLPALPPEGPLANLLPQRTRLDS